VKRLARERVPLTVCPLSNVKLRVFETMAQHSLPALLEAGLCATVNSDDPAYFGGTINTNFTEIFAALPALGPRHAYQLLRNGFDASFVGESQKRQWIDQLDTVFRAAAANR
jgi:adenosine deaminase